MVFNDSTDKLGICQEIDALCDTTTTSYPLADKTRRVNTALETIIGKIIMSDGVWQFDDDNFTTKPEGTATLVEGQSSYNFNEKFLDIESVSILNKESVYIKISPFDPSEIGMSLEEYFGSDSGLPEYYDKVGNMINLYPAPTANDVTLAAGIKIRFKRTGSLFVSTDTTKEPGFASPFHIVLAYMASIPYCITYKKDRVALYEKRVDEMTKEILKYYGMRERDNKKRMTMRSILFR
jgi:hypothetical protein